MTLHLALVWCTCTITVPQVPLKNWSEIPEIKIYGMVMVSLRGVCLEQCSAATCKGISLYCTRKFCLWGGKIPGIKSRRKYGNEIWIFLQLSCSYSNESTIFNVSEYLHFELNSHERSYSRYSPEWDPCIFTIIIWTIVLS